MLWNYMYVVWFFSKVTEYEKLLVGKNQLWKIKAF
jgi:hypothetical protein